MLPPSSTQVTTETSTMNPALPRRTGLRAALGTLLLASMALALIGSSLDARQDKGKDKNKDDKSKAGKTKLGLILTEPGASKGYTLIASMNSRETYLIDVEGRVVNTWKSDCNLGSSAYLLENG